MCLFCLASGGFGDSERERWVCIPCIIATTLTKTAVASYCPFTAGILKRSTTFGKTAVRKQFCSLAYDLRCMAGHVCWLCSTAGTDHCCQLLCCKKQGDWESCWHCSLSTVIRGCFCCCKEENAKGARSHFLALLLNLYKPYLNANFYFASIKKSGVLLF